MRAICHGLPAVEERLSHGAPTFFVEGRTSFVMFMDDHHADGRLALWCAAPAGVQEALVDGNPDGYFRPPYVGHRGWVGVRLDRELAWDEVEGTIEGAWAHVAPKRLLDRVE